MMRVHVVLLCLCMTMLSRALPTTQGQEQETALMSSTKEETAVVPTADHQPSAAQRETHVLLGASATSTLAMPAPVDIEVTSEYRKAEKAADMGAITLALQGDVGRLPRAAVHAEQWDGPISFAVLVRNAKETEQVDAFWSSASSKVKDYVTLHLCLAQAEFERYPINKMRNAAMSNVKSEWTYILDTDEDTSGGNMAQHLLEVKRAEDKFSHPDKPAYVVMSWQYTRESGKIPQDKEELKRLREDNSRVGHKSRIPTSYVAPGVKHQDWLEMSEAQATRYGDRYEPYYIARTPQLVEFDPRFSGFGYNKRIQCLEMAAKHFQFIVLPNVFNFDNESRDQLTERRVEGEMEFFEGAFKEVGMKYGCDKCTPMECVSRCPGMFV